MIFASSLGTVFEWYIGNGWFGGFLRSVSFALVAWTGDIYFWYPIAVAVMTFAVGALFLRETRGVALES